MMAYSTPITMLLDEDSGEFITNQETWMLVPPRDVQLLSVALYEVLINSELLNRIEGQYLIVYYNLITGGKNADTRLEALEKSISSDR